MNIQQLFETMLVDPTGQRWVFWLPPEFAHTSQEVEVQRADGHWEKGWRVERVWYNTNVCKTIPVRRVQP